ncbi:MAG: hypothetical protein ACKVVP_19490, partial [Chloroflexota bacterium]
HACGIHLHGMDLLSPHGSSVTAWIFCHRMDLLSPHGSSVTAWIFDSVSAVEKSSRYPLRKNGGTQEREA